TQAADVFPLVVLGTLLWQLAQIYQKSFEISADTKPLRNYIAAAVLVNVVLNCLMVPRGGLVGAGIATTVSYSLYLLLVCCGDRNFGVPKLKKRTIVNVMAGSALSVVVFSAVSGFISGRASAAIGLVFSGVAYLVFLFLSKEPLVVSNIRRLLEIS